MSERLFTSSPDDCSYYLFIYLHYLHPIMSVVEVNLLCGQRRPLLAQMGSSNNQITLTHRFLIENQRPMMRAYLDSNASTCRRVVAPIPLLQLVTIPTILVNGTPAHAKNDTNTSIKSNRCNYISVRKDITQSSL